MCTFELGAGRSRGIPHCAAHLPLGCRVADLQLPLAHRYLWLWKRSQRLATSVLEVEHTLALQRAQHPVNVHTLHCLHLDVGVGIVDYVRGEEMRSIRFEDLSIYVRILVLPPLFVSLWHSGQTIAASRIRLLLGCLASAALTWLAPDLDSY
jgi:hypothetical protein